jgi:hypothetical protein
MLKVIIDGKWATDLKIVYAASSLKNVFLEKYVDDFRFKNMLKISMDGVGF